MVEGPQARAELPGRPSASPGERRNLAGRRALAQRIHAEFLDMPGLTLSIGQAARLFGLTADVGARILGELVRSELLQVTDRGQFALLPGTRRTPACD